MYVFTSAIFFLIFFMVVDPRELVKINKDTPLNTKERQEVLNDLEKELTKSEVDSTIVLKIERLRDATRPVTQAILDSLERSDSISKGPKTFAEYDSLQKTLRPDDRDGWFLREMAKKFTYNEELRADPMSTFSHWAEVFLHKLPYLLFISLPLFALTLKLLYVRRKQFYYADHAIFTIHHYIFSFILLLLVFLSAAVARNPSFDWLKIIMVGLFIVWPVHLYLAMLNFYRQGWFKTFVKFCLLNILAFFSLLILFVIFLFFSIFQT
jgi:hypothetical protein